MFHSNFKLFRVYFEPNQTWWVLEQQTNQDNFGVSYCFILFFYYFEWNVTMLWCYNVTMISEGKLVHLSMESYGFKVSDIWLLSGLREIILLFTKRCIAVGIFSITMSLKLRITIWAVTSTFSGCKLTV